MNYPILYSLQHCPYAMRARMGIVLAEQCVRLRAIVLKNKPKEMLTVSPKGSVPVLVIEEHSVEGEPSKINPSSVKVIDESLDIMLWALTNNDPRNLLYRHQPHLLPEMLETIGHFDNQFKNNLERYQSAKRYHDDDKVSHRQACEKDLSQLELRLSLHQYLVGDELSLLDFAILPYIRKFAKVERQWYLASPYPKLKAWLKNHIDSRLFAKVMAKYPLWLDNNEVVIFGCEKV